MRHPLTLLTREVAPVPLSREQTVLLLQDVHAPFTDLVDGWLMREARRKVVEREFDDYTELLPSALANAAILLNTVRDLGMLVVYTCLGVEKGAQPSALQTAMGWAWSLEGPDGRFPEELVPRDDEPVMAKGGWGALGGTDFHSLLEDAKIASVLLVGFPFDFGIRQTCYELADAGFRTLVATDATVSLTAAAEAPTRGNLAHGATKFRSTAETLALLTRIPSEGTVWV